MPTLGRKRPLSEYRPEYHQLMRMKWEWMRPGNTEWGDWDELDDGDSEFMWDGLSLTELLPTAEFSTAIERLTRSQSEAEADDEIVKMDLRHAMAKLDPEEITLIGPWSQGWTIAEIAQMTGRSLTSVHMRIQRILAKLRGLMT